MRKFVPAALCAALLLGGCGQEDAANAAAPAAAAASQGFTGALRPGLYKIVQTGDADDESERCITADMIATSSYASAKDLQPGWTFVRNRLANGVVDVEAHGPAKGKMVFKGNYTATSFKLDAVLTFENDGQLMTLTNHQTGSFIAADCGEAAE